MLRIPISPPLYVLDVFVMYVRDSDKKNCCTISYISEENILKYIQNKRTPRVEKTTQSIKWLFWFRSVNKTWKLGALEIIT